MALDEARRRQVSQLIALVHSSDLAEIHIEDGSFALHIERDLLLGGPATPAPAAPVAAEPAATGAAYLRSPQVGTFYLSAEPGGEPFLHEGDAVEPGQVIGLIEAMKLISEVEAEAGGVVERILVHDGQAVEYGEPLFELAPMGA